MKKEITRIDKDGEEITKNISYILQFIDSPKLWQAHYEILLIIYLKDFIELNVNQDMTIKNMKHVELNTSIATVFSNIQTLKMT